MSGGLCLACGHPVKARGHDLNGRARFGTHAPCDLRCTEGVEFGLVWLSTKTGATYRLPNKAEAESLHKRARKTGAKENSLNYWAGYDLTIADLEDFKKKVEEAKQSLIKEVGSFKSTKVGEAEVYDLGGNVSEYRNDGKKYGFSAYDYVDPNGDSDEAGKASHTGFRVIKE